MDERELIYHRAIRQLAVIHLLQPVVVLVRIILGRHIWHAFQLEDVHSLCVGTAAQVVGARAKRKRSDGDTALYATTKLEQFGAVFDGEHADDGALLAGRRNL